MKKNDLIAELQRLPGNPEIELGNVMIQTEDMNGEEGMPTFDILEIQHLKELVDAGGGEVEDVAIIFFKDYQYLNESVINRDLLAELSVGEKEEE